jgi:ferric-dicitrate binding protein FerR (iron transport regulator)
MEHEIEYIITAYLSGEITGEERGRLNEWLREERHQQEFREHARAYYRARAALAWDGIREEQAGQRVNARLSRGRWFFWARCAASLALIVTAIAWWRVATRDAAPAGTNPLAGTGPAIPTLTLPDGQVIEIDSTRREGRFPAGLPITWDQASSLEYEQRSPATAAEIQYHTLVIPTGCEFNLLLSDGTRVRLNAGSSLRYPDRFPEGKREVTLSGEAYFEVVHDPRNPFHVKTAEMELTVLGTAFDIAAYPDEAEIVTTLVSGKVLQRFEGYDKEVILLPGEGATYNTHSRSLVKGEADIEEALAWKEGRFIARHRSLEKIFNRLSKWYNFEVVYADPALKEIHFYLNIKRYSDIREVLENLSSTNGVTLTLVKNTIYISK